MRQADINRVVKAREYINAAITTLTIIKWENTKQMEDDFIRKAKETMKNARGHLDDIINIQDTER